MGNNVKNCTAEEFIKLCLVDDCIGFWENLRDWEGNDFGGIYYSEKGLPDPDWYGYQLYNFHEALWNIQRLKFSHIPELKNNSDYEYNKKKSVGWQYVRVLSNTDKSIRLGSDSIMNIYWHTCNERVLMEQLKDNKEQKQYTNALEEVEKLNSFTKEIRKYNKNAYKSDWKKFIWLYLQKANTIGGFILFPKHDLPNINSERGNKSGKIRDRFDLTLECIRRYYQTKDDNPLFDVLKEDKDFFRMFGEGKAGFEKYAEFFCLNGSWVENGKVLNLLYNDENKDKTGRNAKTLDEWDFSQEPLPNSAEWWTFYCNIMNRLDARNRQIKEITEKSL